MAINKQAFEPPGLAGDPGAGGGVQRTGCGDPSFINLRASAVVPMAKEPCIAHGPVDGRFYIANCSILNFFVDFTIALLDSVEFYPEFSDEGLVTWFPATCWDLTAGSGVLVHKPLVFQLDADAKRIIQIPNPGAAWGRLQIDGTGAGGNVGSDATVYLSRGWGSILNVTV